MVRASLLSLFGPLCAFFLVPAKVATAAARSRGQGRPLGRRALRASLDGGEHGRTLETGGITHKPSRETLAVLATLLLSAATWLTPFARSYGATAATSVGTLSAVVDEAAARFNLPSRWLYAVIEAESGGKANAVSSKGAMGLMQLMPATWRVLSVQHGLGSNPFDRRSNVLAGAAYLRELYDRFGPQGFLAAYNAGPARYAEARAGGRRLPAETVTYVAKVEASIRAARNVEATKEAVAGMDWRAAELFVTSSEDHGGDVAETLFVGTSGRVSP